MTGLELLPKAKALRPDVPVIMITAYGDAETKRKALEPIREVLESDESDVIHCWALDSLWSARCGSPNTAKLRTAVAFVTRAI